MVSKELVLSFQSIVNKRVRFIPRLRPLRGFLTSNLRLPTSNSNDDRRRGPRLHVLPGRARARRPAPEARCADLPSPSERAAKRCRTQGNYRGSEGPRRDRPWTPKRVSRRWPLPEAPLAWKSCARRTQPRAAHRTSGTRYRSTAPPLPAREFPSCNADIRERSRFTSETIAYNNRNRSRLKEGPQRIPPLAVCFRRILRTVALSQPFRAAAN